MTAAAMASQSPEQRAWRQTLWLVGAITAARALVLILSPLQLYPDEAQYWFWAQTPDLGYFSKPPLIAWIIWTTTHLFGEREWAIRIASPLLHGGTALMLYWIGRKIGDARLGLWSAFAYATLPGVSYSAILISTDVPLLFCWAVALYALLEALDDESWRWPLLCGAAIGFGMLAKYAMLYFVIGMALGALVSPRLRRLVLSTRGLVIIAVALALFAPNIYWNATHRFPTVGHTAANANWAHSRFSLKGMAGFLAGQFGVFGPLLMGAFGLACWQILRGRRRGEHDLILAAFALPALLIIALQSFISEANANWAATAYIAATPLAASVLLDLPWALALSFAIDGLAMLLLWVMVVSPPVGERLGFGNAFKREEGWRELGSAVTMAAHGGPFDAIAVANRSLIAELTYYAPHRPVPLRAWGASTRITDHFEMVMRLTPADRRVLLVLEADEARYVLPTFESAHAIGRIDQPIGGHHHRVVTLYDANGYRGPQPAH